MQSLLNKVVVSEQRLRETENIERETRRPRDQSADKVQEGLFSLNTKLSSSEPNLRGEKIEELQSLASQA